MGLDSFKTDGPRTYKKGGTATANVSNQCIHIVNGMDERGHDYLKRHEVHIALKTPEAMNLELPNGGPYFICSECGKLSTSYEGLLKSDLVDYVDKDWVLDAKEELIEEFKTISEEVFHDDGLEGVEVQDDEDAESQTTSSGGSSSSSSTSSSSDEDFDSGLGSFMS